VPLDSFSLQGGARREIRRTLREVEREGAAFEERAETMRRTFVGFGSIRPFALALLLILSRPAAADPATIVAVGASNTSGFNVGEQNAYPARLEALLRAKGVDAVVINAGVGFDTTAGMLRRIDSSVPDGTKLVILQPGGNDRRFFVTREQRAANIAAIADRLRARGIKVVVFDPDFPSAYYIFDGIHFTAAAHAQIAERLLPEVMVALPKRARRSEHR
jgi:acyl-CoA thioesterase-1